VPLLEVENVSKRFGGIVALDAVSFGAEPGEIVGLIGPNGAGKTTAFNVITRLYTPDDGDVRFEVVTTGRRLKQALEVFYRLEASGWKGRSGTAVTQRSQVKRFYDGLVDRAEVWIPILTVCGDPVAAYVLRVSGHTIFALKTGYDQTYSKYAPGLLLTSRVIRYGLEHGMEMLDLMADKSRWKADWAREVRPHYELLLFAPTPTGRYAYWVRYGMRQQAKRLPGAARLARWLRA